ncbi:hypothetical protein AB0C33_35510 [Nonomuraea sp. NPDC048881]|uniref:hypothetical protein n=1 Tax=Nonomuraea sp. NPDC048881 TaxID=3155030 RepID=UPI0033E1D4C2
MTVRLVVTRPTTSYGWWTGLALAFLPRAMPPDALADPRHRTLLDAMAQVIGA